MSTLDITQCHADMVATLLKQFFTEFCHRAHLCVCVVVGLGLLGVNSHSCPADVLVDGRERAQSAAFDVIVTSRLTLATSGDACKSAGGNLCTRVSEALFQ